MKRALEVAPGERLEGVQVIGFHGGVAPEHTPGQREPVLANSQGRLVGIERVEYSPAGPPQQSVWTRTGELWRTGLLPGHATLLESPWPAYWGHIVMVLGQDEQAHASSLATIEPRVENPRVNELVRWLSEPANAPPPPLTQRLGELVAWYCSPAQAFALYQRIARVAEKEMIRAANAGEDGAVYRASWWLTRAALDDTGRYLAAVGLEHSDPGMAEAYLKSTFRKTPAEEIEAALSHARGVFTALCAAERHTSGKPEAASPARSDPPHTPWRADTGSLSHKRDSVRERFKVPPKQPQKAA
jgi:hypothetical protein